MTDTTFQDVLNALFAGAPQDPITLSAGDVTRDVADAPAMAAFRQEAGDEAIYVHPVTASGEAVFFYQFAETAAPDEWRDLVMKPTLVLTREASAITVWALETPVVVDMPIMELALRVGGDTAEPIPTPGANGWVVAHLDAEAFQPLEAFLDAYDDEAQRTRQVQDAAAAKPRAAEVAPWEDEPIAVLDRFLDADVLAPYDESDPALAAEMTISLGRNVKDTHWKPKTMPVGQFVAIMSTHPVSPKKDGAAFVMAAIAGENRTKTAVKACYGVGLDIDVGTPGAEIDAALKKLGCLAIRYTTHSHFKTTSEITKDVVARKYPGEAVNEAQIKRYLSEEKRWAKAILDTLEYTGDEHGEKGLMAQLSHAPMPKHRVVMPLAEPFEPARVANTHQEGMALWNKLPQALARLLGDLPLDRSALDPSRLFYFPRHDAKRPFQTTLFGGPLLDWRTLELDPPASDNIYEAYADEVDKTGGGASKTSRSTTDKGRELGRWSVTRAAGFQIVDVLRDHAAERIRTNGATKVDIECPFDDEHSNPGDPEDRACMAVNAGDGPASIFTIKCQHDTCHARTNLDFLGKMFTDGWFDESVLEDEAYNAILDETQVTPLAAKIEQEDTAREAYQEAIDKLTKEAEEDEIEAALRLMVEANLNHFKREKAFDALRDKLKIKTPVLTRMIKGIERDMQARDNRQGAARDPLGRLVFSYQGEYNFDEAFDICFKALTAANDAEKKPVFSCLQDKPVRMSANKQGRIVFEEIAARGLWSELNKRVTFVRKTEAGAGDSARQAVPKEVSEHVYEQAYDHLPQAPEIIYTPLYTFPRDPSGKATTTPVLITQPGWYPELDVLMADTGFKVPAMEQTPTALDVEEAVRFLTEEVLGDFPFLDYDLKGEERRAPSEANALAMILTPFMRRLIHGSTPVFFVSKPTPGTGGTLLGKVPMLLFDGAESAPLRYTQNEEEMQKALLASIMETRSHLFFDDMKEFNSRSLLQSITSQHIGGRMLGASKTVERPNRFNWIATGNNPNVMNEMERRICWIRLNAKTVDIQQRVYRHEDYTVFLTENRAKAVHAVLTLIQNWISLGMPLWKERKQASFEDWAAKVGGVLHHAGVEGFLDNRRAAAADMDERATKTFVKEWMQKFGYEQISVQKLYEHAMFMEMDIIEGNNDDQKKSRFPKRVNSMEGRAFKIGDNTYMVRTRIEEDETYYFIAPLDDVTQAA